MLFLLAQTTKRVSIAPPDANTVVILTAKKLEEKWTRGLCNWSEDFEISRVPVQKTDRFYGKAGNHMREHEALGNGKAKETNRAPVY